MVSLGTLGQRFETTLTTEQNIPFKGTIQPIQDTKIYPDDFFYIRQILRVRPEMPAKAGMIIKDPTGQHFILGEMDQALQRDTHIYTSFVLFPATKLVLWKREETITDPLTGLEKTTGQVHDLDSLWVLIETVNRELSSQTFKTKEEAKRVITGAEVRLNDIVDNHTVRKVNATHGIRVLEIA